MPFSILRKKMKYYIKNVQSEPRAETIHCGLIRRSGRKLQEPRVCVRHTKAEF